MSTRKVSGTSPNPATSGQKIKAYVKDTALANKSPTLHYDKGEQTALKKLVTFANKGNNLVNASNVGMNEVNLVIKTKPVMKAKY